MSEQENLAVAPTEAENRIRFSTEYLHYQHFNQFSMLS